MPKPFVHLSYYAKTTPHAGGQPQVKKLQLLVQEFDVQVDQGFINALLLLMTSQEAPPVYGVRQLIRFDNIYLI